MLQKDVLQQHTQKFITRIREQAFKNEGVVDFTTWLTCLTTDIIGDLAFSANFGGLDQGQLQPGLQTIFSSLKMFTFVKELLRLPRSLAKAVKMLLSVFVLERSGKVSDFGVDVAAERRVENVERSDFTSYMSSQDDVGGKG